MPDPITPAQSVIVNVQQPEGCADGCAKAIAALLLIAIVGALAFLFLMQKSCEQLFETRQDLPATPAPAPITPGTKPREIPADDYQSWPQGSGIEITSITPGSQAALAGLLIGDVITSYNKQAVNSVEDFTRQTSDSGKIVLDKDQRTMLIRRNGELRAFRMNYGKIGVRLSD